MMGQRIGVCMPGGRGGDAGIPLLVPAIALAVQVHRDKKDKGGQPYILHPLRVILAQENGTAMMVGVPHNVVEDSAKDEDPNTIERLRGMGCSEEVLEALDCVTRRPGETYDDFMECAAQNPLARAATNTIARKVKIADLEDNMDLLRRGRRGTAATEQLGRYLEVWQRLRGEGARVVL